MNEHLLALETALSDVGYWRWWTANLLAVFQIEIGGAQLWSSPREEGQPPSGLVALRFAEPRLVYFLTFEDDAQADWPDLLHRDELPPPNIDHASFSLTSPDFCERLVASAASVRSLIGEPNVPPFPTADDAFLGFQAGSVGLVVAARSLQVLNHLGALDEAAVLAGIRKWWEYWREYWRCKETLGPLPYDYACEATIPLAPEPKDDLS